MKWLLSAILGIIVVSGTMLWWGWTDLNRYADRPAAEKDRPRVHEIHPGSSLNTIARELADAGLIEDPLRFQLLARLLKLDRRLKAGEYLLSAHHTPRRILSDLVEGRVMLHKLTIPEGFTLSQVVALLAQSGLAAAADFEVELSKSKYREQLGIPGKNLEGYLFPDTYLFPRGATAAEIVTALVTRFQEVFTPSWKKRAAQMGFSIHEIVTLAAIIEKETGQAKERALIGSVFHNRLKKKMRLESDPTVIYGLTHFDGNLTRRHLRTPTPYNTYTISGLPPGPIANPGKAALMAALYPLDSPYLYFVSKNDGSHHFSTRYSDHLKAVRKFQLTQ